jgi:hypothetical protein
VFAVVLLGALAAAGAARAGAPPNRLDKNLGFVVASPHLHNLFWDSGWNAHNQFSTASIDTFTSHLATNGYMNGLGQYGVGAATFSSATLANSACGASRAPNGLSTATLMAWAACELSNPFSGVPLPAPRLPVSNDLYVLYLPQNATIVDKYTIPQFSVLGHTFGPFTLAEIGTSCLDFGAEHVILPTVLGFVQLAIVPTRCAVQSGSFADITTGASHEIAEGAADAVPQGGWIDNSVPAAQRFMLGEAGDVCAQASGALVPTAPVSLNGFMFSPYWENSPGKCGVGAAVGKFRLTPRITTARRGSTATLTMTWIAPHRWRDLRTVELEVLDGTRLVGLGRFINDGSKTGRLGLGRGAGKPGAHRSLRGGPLTLRLSNSSVATSGPTGKTVTVHLALRFAPKLAKHVLTLELGATDRQGDREPFRPGGAIGIR